MLFRRLICIRLYYQHLGAGGPRCLHGCGSRFPERLHYRIRPKRATTFLLNSVRQRDSMTLTSLTHLSIGSGPIRRNSAPKPEDWIRSSIVSAVLVSAGVGGIIDHKYLDRPSGGPQFQPDLLLKRRE